MVLAVLCSMAVQAGEVPEHDTVIFARHALLVADEPVRENVSLYVRDGRLVAVEQGPVAADPGGDSGVRHIDLSCCFVVPGLIDTQTHLQSQLGLPPTMLRLVTWTDADNALQAYVHGRRTLAAGFTTIRDMGSHGDAMYALRDAIDAGKVPGPRIQVAGEIIMATGGDLRDWYRPEVEAVFHTGAVCDGADDCRRAIREQVALGSDTIKVATKYDLADGSESQFTLEELRAMAEAAHALGVKITASAFSADSINRPLEAGFDAVVHGTFVDDESLKLLKRSGAWYIPTLVAARTVKEMAENPDLPLSDAWREENLAIYHGMVASFQRVRRTGLPIAFGTDAGWRPHGGNAEHLVQMVELGMEPADVIATATLNAARAMGWAHDVGSLEVGKYADLVAVRGSPLSDISVLTRPYAVIKGGQPVARTAP